MYLYSFIVVQIQLHMHTCIAEYVYIYIHGDERPANNSADQTIDIFGVCVYNTVAATAKCPLTADRQNEGIHYHRQQIMSEFAWYLK